MDEARAVMGQPGEDEVEALVGREVECHLGDGEAVYGVLESFEDGVLVVDKVKVPLRAVEALRAL